MLGSVQVCCLTELVAVVPGLVGRLSGGSESEGKSGSGRGGSGTHYGSECGKFGFEKMLVLGRPGKNDCGVVAEGQRTLRTIIKAEGGFGDLGIRTAHMFQVSD